MWPSSVARCSLFLAVLLVGLPFKYTSQLEDPVGQLVMRICILLEARCELLVVNVRS